MRFTSTKRFAGSRPNELVDTGCLKPSHLAKAQGSKKLHPPNHVVCLNAFSKGCVSPHQPGPFAVRPILVASRVFKRRRKRRWTSSPGVRTGPLTTDGRGAVVFNGFGTGSGRTPKRPAAASVRPFRWLFGRGGRLGAPDGFCLFGVDLARPMVNDRRVKTWVTSPWPGRHRTGPIGPQMRNHFELGDVG